MHTLKHNLSLRVSQRQILTPGLVQMVSVLALNKLELKDMINAEIVENPVLEELEATIPLLDEAARREEERAAAPDENVTQGDKKDSFEEIDFGSFFQDYLDPGYRSTSEMEEVERPSFENFLSKPTNLTDHLAWQLGSLSVRPEVHRAAELVIGNLNEDGYLTASEEELLGLAPPSREGGGEEPGEEEKADEGAAAQELAALENAGPAEISGPATAAASGESFWVSGTPGADLGAAVALAPSPTASTALPAPEAKPQPPRAPTARVDFTREDVREAIALIQQMDPVGVAARDLRECLLAQLRHLRQIRGEHKNGEEAAYAQTLDDGIAIVENHLRAVQNKQHREIAKALGRPAEAVQLALDFIRTLDPRPGLRYNKVQPRLIEPDVAFVKQGDEWLVMFNDDDVPQLRLNPTYKRLLNREDNDKDTRNYVKERYKSAIQLIKNIEQRKQTILRVCYCIVQRQEDFLEHGIDWLKPMMIKEVAEEIGVHPSTVSRAVANKYSHTPQGVFELRYFFSESVQGPQGGGTSLLILKRRVKKLIEDEDPARPLTDEQITRILHSQGIQVTRRTVAKYREDMRIPSTHQRRVKK
jgi:RNA polymerase sigma-54 factor